MDGADRRRKHWCSLAAHVDRALVSAWAGEERRLFEVDLHAPGVSPVAGTWVARGLPDVDSGPVDLDGVPAGAVGGAGWYLERPGFAWGGIGVAAVWYGGAVGVARRLLAGATGGRTPDQVALMHLGAVDAALHAARCALADAAAAIDAGAARSGSGRAVPRCASARWWPRRPRRSCTRAAHGLGPGPLATEEEHVRRVVDLELYVRQWHAERDQAALGGLLLDDPDPRVVTARAPDPDFRHDEAGTPAAAWSRALAGPPAARPRPVRRRSTGWWWSAPTPTTRRSAPAAWCTSRGRSGWDGARGRRRRPARAPTRPRRPTTRARSRPAAAASSSGPRRCSPAVPRWSASGTPTARWPTSRRRWSPRSSTPIGVAGERTLLAAPWRHDGHPDHEAVGRAAAVAARRTDARLVEYPVWMWHWGTEQDLPWPDARGIRARRRPPGRPSGRPSPRTPARSPRSPTGPVTRCSWGRRCSRTSTATWRSSSSRPQPAGDDALDRVHRDRDDPWDVDGVVRAAQARDHPRQPAARALRAGARGRLLGRGPGRRPRRRAATTCWPSTPARPRWRPPAAGWPAPTTSTYAAPRSRRSGRRAASTWCRCRRSATSSARGALAELVSRAPGSRWPPTGHLLLCHWRHDLVGWPLDGPAVHDAFLATGARVLAEHHDPDFVLHVLGRTS